MTFSMLVEELGRDASLPFRNRFFFSSCESTNELGRALAGAGSMRFDGEGEVEKGIREPEPLVIVAASQRSGRGRRGNRWHSPEGGIYATIVLPRIRLVELHLLPLLTGIGLCSALEELLSRPCRLKWPNDLMVGGSKIGGILIEVVSRDSNGCHAVIGFGVNHRTAPMGLGYPATAISREMKRPPRVAETIGALLWSLARELRPPTNPIEVVSRYQAVSAHAPGDTMTCNTDSGTVCGTFLGFDPRGFLRLEVDGREQMIDTAEVVPAGDRKTG